MKKTISIILIVVVAIGSVIGVTAFASRNSEKSLLELEYVECTTSELYEVVQFTAPKKTVYSLSNDVYTIDFNETKNEKEFVQQVNFDGTGMSMTVKNTETNETKKYDYTCEYFDLDGEMVKTEGQLVIFFQSDLNTELTEGEYTAQVILCTDDGESVFHDMKFTLVDDKKTETSTQAPTKANTQTNTQADTRTEVQVPADKPKENTNKNQQVQDEEIVLPNIKSTWNHVNNPDGCSIVINSQDGNTINFTVTSMRGNAAQIATSDITVTLDTEYDGTLVRGNGSFEYVDSFGNEGVGTISVSENTIILTINEEYNAGGGWGIDYATGKYI